ncbi:phage tail protein [Akkermansiaceae bacterium]|nr:phage tail protein [Akkermansiaceae bacterium]
MVFVTAAIALGNSIFFALGLPATASLGVLAAVGFAGQIALGAAIRALTPKPSVPNRGYQVNSRGSALDHQIIYGKVRVGGAIVYDESTGTNNKFLHRIIAVAGHEVESFDRLYINDSYVDVTDIDVEGNVPEVVDSDGSTSDRYDGKLRISFHLGASDQDVDPDLKDESSKWTDQCRLRGIAYMYVRLKFDADVFPNGVPTFTAEVKGKKVYNPSTGTTVWSDNPALCLRDYLTSSYGLAELPANIDDTLINSAVAVCNQTNTDAGTTRYTCNGAFTTNLTPYDAINNILTSMGGTLWYAQGKWRVKPAYWTAPVLDLNEDDLRSSIGVSTRHSRRDNFNVVKGTFRGEESNWQTTDYPQVDSPAFLAADNGQESVADVDLPFTDNSVESRRIARIALERNRQQLTVTASFGLNTMQVQVGDNVRLTNTRFGWTNKEFEVLSWNFGLTDGLDLQVNMTLRETAESVFDEVDDGVVYERDNTTLLSPFDVPTVGIALQAVTQSFVEKVSNSLRINVTSGASERVDYCDVQVKYRGSPQNIKQELLPNALIAAAVNIQPEQTLFEATLVNGRPLGDLTDSGSVGAFDALQYEKYLQGTQTDQDILDYINNVFHPYILENPSVYSDYLTVNLAPDTEYTDLGQGKLGVFLYKDAPTGIYDVRARAYNTFGNTGEWTYYTDFTLTPDLPTPEDVSALDIDVSNGDITLEWEPVTVIDLSHYSIRHSPLTSGATWANSTTSVSKIGRPSTSVTLPARAGTYLVKAHTKLEKESVNATPAVVLPAQIEGFTNTLTLAEASGFSGTKTGTTVVGGSLEISSVAFPYSSGSYVFSSDIDAGADRRVLARIDCASIRRDTSAGLFDDLSGNFDSLTGLFDDLTGAANFGDTNVEFYIATKADGAGSFGDYQKFRVGYYYARYFRFKVILKSNSSGITPSVSALTAYVEYN